MKEVDFLKIELMNLACSSCHKILLQAVEFYVAGRKLHTLALDT